MEGETNLDKLLRKMNPRLNAGEYVFCSVKSLDQIDLSGIISFFKESEGYTVILNKEAADIHQLAYTTVMSWITLTVHSSLEAVGLTAAFSKALTEAGISCNVVAGYFHDHIFVNKNDSEKAMTVLNKLSNV